MRNYPRPYQELWRTRLIKKRAFSLVEISVVVFISLVIFSAVFMVLNMGELQNRVGSTRLDVQQEVRTLLDWIMRDLRQTHRTQMNVTAAGATRFVDLGDDQVFSDPDFQLCLGYNTTTGTNDWTPYTIRYQFDATNETVSRIDSGTNQTLRFHNITDLTFTCIDNINFLRVNITAQKIAKRGSAGNITQAFSLSEEIRLRND